MICEVEVSEIGYLGRMFIRSFEGKGFIFYFVVVVC